MEGKRTERKKKGREREIASTLERKRKKEGERKKKEGKKEGKEGGRGGEGEGGSIIEIKGKQANLGLGVFLKILT